MDPVTASGALGTFAAAVRLFRDVAGGLRDVKEALPKGSERERIEEKLADAEKQLHLAEVEAARAFGYEICRAHWPPEIMLETEGRGVFKCPSCEKTVGGPLRLEKDEEMVLLVVALVSANTEDTVTSKHLAEHMKMHELKAAKILNDLDTRQFIFTRGWNGAYRLAPKGRDYVVKHALVE